MAFKNWILRLFTWWNGQTFGTWLFTRRNGVFVGEDVFGNIYYRSHSGKRWVIYRGYAEASSVPPEWSSWLQGRASTPPLSGMPHYRWEKPHLENKTGTEEAYRPPGSLFALASPPEMGYEPWHPEIEKKVHL